MAEPARSDHDIVVQLFPAPIDATPAQIKTHTQYAGKFAQACKLAREDERRKREPEIEAVRKAVQAALTEAHGKELIAMGLHMQDTVGHVKGAAFWRGVGVMGVVTVLLCAGTAYGVSEFIGRSQANAASMVQAATRPSAERMRDALSPPDASQQPEWARQ